MNRLNNVNRNDGYYLCGENLAVLSDQYRYITALLDGFNLPANTCVFLQLNRGVIGNAVNKLAGGIMYVVNGINLLGGTRIGNIYIVNANNDIDVSDLLTNTLRCDVIVNTVNHNVTLPNNGTCTNAYITDSCDIEIAEVYNGYTFYTLSDIIRQKAGTQCTDIFSNLAILPAQFGSINFATGSDYVNKVMVYDSYVDIQLYFTVTRSIDYTTNVIDYEFPMVGDLAIFPIRRSGDTTSRATGTAYFNNSGMQIIFDTSGNALSLFGTFCCSGRIYY